MILFFAIGLRFGFVVLAADRTFGHELPHIQTHGKQSHMLNVQIIHALFQFPFQDVILPSYLALPRYGSNKVFLHHIRDCHCALLRPVFHGRQWQMSSLNADMCRQVDRIRAAVNLLHAWSAVAARLVCQAVKLLTTWTGIQDVLLVCEWVTKLTIQLLAY
jgi:hypothetical protein